MVLFHLVFIFVSIFQVELLLHGVEVGLLQFVDVFIIVVIKTFFSIIYHIYVNSTLHLVFIIILALKLARIDLVRVRVHHARDFLC